MALKSRNRVMANFAMSGMTDIVFLLLIFFMLTSTLIAPNALKLLLPSRGQVTIQGDSRIPTVTIYSGSRVAVDGRTVSLEDLGMVLESRLQGLPDPTIKVVTSPTVSVGDAVSVMNVAAERNYTVVLKQL
ncbi:MAG: biopolymer transporter ExbD [Bacteroidia bacterium]|jgi:biopolymer transport protein ExbD|nr:MAG: biopolymer transporter ExbD [Bacteroidia bacterium]